MVIKAWQYLLIGCFIVLLARACDMAYEDEVAEQELYCEMVAAGTWPAYRGLDACQQGQQRSHSRPAADLP